MAQALGMALPQVLLFLLIDYFMRSHFSRKIRVIIALVFQISVTTAIAFSNSTIEAAPSGALLFLVIFVFAFLLSLLLILFRPSKNNKKE